MNDFLEVHWGYRIWEQVASRLLNDIGPEFLDKIDRIIHQSGFNALPTVSCFSLSGDVLSQWRAYADDGRGYAIGFDAEQMLQLPVRALRVLYDEGEQTKELTAFIRAIHEVETEAAAENNTPDCTSRHDGEHSVEATGMSDFEEACAGVAFDLTAFKNPAFVEEREVRLIHLLNFHKSNSFLRLVDPGGHIHNGSTPGQPVKFQMRESVPVPYIDIDFTNLGKLSPIREVVLGPKNNALWSAVSVFLETSDIPSVLVKNSRASYR